MDESSHADTALDPGCAQTNDQRFLLFFIMGTYFGADIKEEIPQKAVLQRIAEGLPPYSSDELVGSNMKIAEIEQVFRYVLRKADKSAMIPSPLLWSQFFKGNLPKCEEDPSADYPQFPDLFPPELHPCLDSGDGNAVVENVAFISDPEVYYLDLDDVERFRRLSGLEDFLLNEAAVKTHEPDGELSPFPSPTKKMRRIDELLGGPTSEFTLKGSAAEGKFGSSIGLIDIGECCDSYLFRISLPGVKRDAREFCCEVESNGKVLLRGVTSAGEKVVYRYSHKFEMQTQNLCPPGRFSISFKLPGPVDPQQFSGNFGTDGILEGIVMKDKRDGW